MHSDFGARLSQTLPKKLDLHAKHLHPSTHFALSLSLTLIVG